MANIKLPTDMKKKVYKVGLNDHELAHVVRLGDGRLYRGMTKLLELSKYRPPRRRNAKRK
jgi:hypothetical protein